MPLTACESSGCGTPHLPLFAPLRQAAGRYAPYTLLLWSIESDFVQFMYGTSNKRGIDMMNREERIKLALEEYAKFTKEVNDTTRFSASCVIEIIKNASFSVVDNERIFEHCMSDTLDKLGFKNRFSGLSRNCEKNCYYYVWIGLTKDNCPVVVGRSSFPQEATSEFGDLFLSYSVFGSVSQEIIINLIAPEEIDKLRELDKRINEFINKAIVIPVDVNTIEDANEIETQIGELLKNKVPLLDKISHLL